MPKKTDILIVGGGSAGFGAAYRALASGKYHVTLVEKNPGLGGTSTYGGVNCWEPGYGGHGVHHVLSERLQAMGAGFVGETVSFVSPDTPWSASAPSQDPYKETLERSYRNIHQQRRFHFEPQVMSDVMLEMLRQRDVAGKLEVLFESAVTDVEVENRQVVVVGVEGPEGKRRIEPSIVLDCTGDIVVARMAGCVCSVGEDSAQDHAEPNAPDEPQRIVNGLSLIFRVTPCDEAYVDEIPAEYADVDLSDWLKTLEMTNCPISCFNYYPNGDINVNMLPTLPGEMWLDRPHEEVLHIARARVYAYWHWIRTKKNFKGYRIKEIFPMPGIRESYRLKGRYVLKEQDLRNGFSAELGMDHTIAFADHPADIHGKTNKTGGMTMFAPYGIPYECMLPKELDNVLVACRGASFSHIAASSARLSRTMMALGEAAGEAALQCVVRGIVPPQVDIAALREKLCIR